MDNDPIVKKIKLIVTHMNPDQDAIGSSWLFRRFGGRDFEQASHYFVSAGHKIGADVLEAKELDPEEVVHVDTGMGVFDHHQPDNTKRDSATLRVYEYLIAKHKELADDQALSRLVDFINEVDHFAECYWPEANNDRYVFMLDGILQGLRSGRHFNDHEVLDFGMVCLDGIYNMLKIKISAEHDLDSMGYEFDTPWGKGLAIENQNDDVIEIAQKRGFQVVVRKDAERKHVRIKAAPEKGIDLTPIYRKIQEIDLEGTWFLHPSKQMLLNGSKKSGMHVASPLTLEQVVELFGSVDI